MRSDRFYVVQVGLEIPVGTDMVDTPEEAPRMGELLAQVEDVAGGFDGALVSDYIYNPHGQHECLVRTIEAHRQTPGGRCRCGWPGGMGESWAEHVARVYAVAASVEASQ